MRLFVCSEDTGLLVLVVVVLMMTMMMIMRRRSMHTSMLRVLRHQKYSLTMSPHHIIRLLPIS